MEDTIAAVATAYGEGGIGIIRISGEQAKEILAKVFKPNNIIDISSIVNKRLYYGHIIDNYTNQLIDEVLAVFMKGPATYTVEDVVEIYCHGSIVSLRKTLALILKNGARLAEKGEFTKRAFLNGRLDLTQAEAVIDVIQAKTEKGFHVALDQMEGLLSERIKNLRQNLVDLLVEVTVNLDYPDEDIEELTYEKLSDSLKQINDMIQDLLSTAETGRLIREGLQITIIGKPNVGKSSLMNALLKESRAIVTEIPGTTRDTIEEYLVIKDIPIRLTDTAGIRETSDKIEQIGIKKSKESFNKADLIIFIVDGSNPLSEEDYEIIRYIEARKTIVLINKTDLDQQIKEEDLVRLLPEAVIIKGAVRQGHGISDLEDQITELVYGGKVKQDNSMVITNIRHKDLLERAAEAIGDAAKMTENREALDFIEVDIKRGWELLGEIIGETVTDDIIDKVFERFCLGK